MLDVAAHERGDEARPEMMRVGICDDGRRLKSRKWRRLNLMLCQKASASTPSSLDLLVVGWLAFGAVGLGASAVVFAGLGLFAPTLLPL